MLSPPDTLHQYWQPTLRYCRSRARAVLVLAAVLALTVALVYLPLNLVNQLDYRALGNWGYVAVFLITLLATAAIVIPVPYLATIPLAGTFLDPTLVALVAGVAAALGELTGYLVGSTGRALLPETHGYRCLQRSVARFGGPVIFGFALIPNPFFDAVGALAGAARLPVWLFLLACFLGKALRFWLLARWGASLLPV